MKKEKLKNLFVKIYETELFQRLFYRPFHAKTTLSGLSAMLYYIIGGILLIVLLTAINVKPKPENELYETKGIVTMVSTTPTNRSNPHIEVQTDDGEKILFSYSREDIKTIGKLKGQKVTIYSNKFPRNINKPGVAKLIDEKGNNVTGNYDYKALKTINDFILSKRLLIACLFLLMLIYFMNGSKKYKNDENQVNSIKE